MNKYGLLPFRHILFDEGDGGGSQGDDDKSGGGKQSADDQNKTKALSQAEIDKLVGSARVDGRSSGQKDILEKAGYKNIDELLAAVNAHKQSEQEKLTELEKAQNDAKDAKTRYDQLAAELSTIRLQRSFETKVAALEIEFASLKAAETAFTLLDKEAAGKGDKEMEAAIKVLVDEHSYLFGEADPGDIDATRKSKTSQATLKKEVVESKRRSGDYGGL